MYLFCISVLWAGSCCDLVSSCFFPQTCEGVLCRSPGASCAECTRGCHPVALWAEPVATVLARGPPGALLRTVTRSGLCWSPFRARWNAGCVERGLFGPVPPPAPVLALLWRCQTWVCAPSPVFHEV